MKKLFLVYIFLGVALCTFAFSRCGPRIPSATGYRAGSPPGLIHVSNGQYVAFYNSTGALDVSLTLGESVGTTQPFAQNNTTGVFYLGTSTAVPTNYVFYLSGLRASYQFASLMTSQFALESPGYSTGVAVNSSGTTLYVADSYNQVVYYLNALSLSYFLGTGVNSTFAAPTGLGASYVGYANNMIIVTENVVGAAYFMNSANGDAVLASGSATYLPLTNAGTSCTTPANVYETAINPNSNIAYILCGGSVIYMSMATGVPNYLFGSLIGSTIATTGIVAGSDLTYDSVDNSVFIVGGSIVLALDGQSASTTNSVDLSTYGCGAGLSLGGVAYSPATKLLYVTDTANSQVYLLNASTLALSTGSCVTSVFSTATNVSHPTKIGYY